MWVLSSLQSTSTRVLNTPSSDWCSVSTWMHLYRHRRSLSPSLKPHNAHCKCNFSFSHVSLVLSYVNSLCTRRAMRLMNGFCSSMFDFYYVQQKYTNIKRFSHTSTKSKEYCFEISIAWIGEFASIIVLNNDFICVSKW